MPEQIKKLECDVLIVGSGPIGATFARALAMNGKRVLMVDTGAQLSVRPGAHLKNAFIYQRDIDKFTPIVQGNLHQISVPTNSGYTTNLDPISFQPRQGIRSAQNPRQNPYKNLEAAAATYAVGGMFTHWTSNTPRAHATERIKFISDAEWNELYPIGERLLSTRTDVFIKSIRHTLVKEALQKHYGSRLKPPYHVQELPVAGKRRVDNDEFVNWTGSDTVLGPLIDKAEEYRARFRILEQHRVKNLVLSKDGGRVEAAIVENFIEDKTIRVEAADFVVAAGAIGTPQLLWKSGIRPEALGRYLTEHPMTFCQVVLSEKIVNSARNDQRFAEALKRHEKADPVPIPMHDPPPMVWIPVSDSRPWHCQIHRDSFSYGALPADIDTRLVVDLRWFGMVEPDKNNLVKFEDDLNDKFGMPKPTFEYELGPEDKERCHLMMQDMLEAAGALGGFFPGSEPQFMRPGTSLHIQGTYRMGEKADDTCVTDPHSNVWTIKNLWLGGNGIIPTKNACNPTLTAMALAARACTKLLRKTIAELADSLQLPVS